MTGRLLIAFSMLFLSSHPLQAAYDFRLCVSCRNVCDSRAESDDEQCCRQAQGTRTKDFCFSKRAADYVACSDGVSGARQTCRAMCERSACAR